jgi:lysyl-tRNA synthetase class 2
MSDSKDSWQPSASLANLQRRAAALSQARAFFAKRAVMEVDTPLIVNAPVSDVHIHSAEVHFPDAERARFFLHTSPEFAMKRLLAAGSGDIYQICHVARGLERGRHHNAEFTLIEWYRAGFTLEQLMDEVDTLVREVLGTGSDALMSERLSYRDAFVRELGLDPLTCPYEQLLKAAREAGFDPTQQEATAAPSRDTRPLAGSTSTHSVTAASAHDAVTSKGASARDELLDFLMAAHIGPRLGRGALTFVHRYPSSQAALARLDPADPRCALRFELYCEGLELANGFQELASAQEQRARFEHDLEQRRRRGLPAHAYDERLLAALDHGLPDCAGVALGFDRLLMLATNASHIDDVLPFPVDRA